MHYVLLFTAAQHLCLYTRDNSRILTLEQTKIDATGLYSLASGIFAQISVVVAFQWYIAWNDVIAQRMQWKTWLVISPPKTVVKNSGVGGVRYIPLLSPPFSCPLWCIYRPKYDCRVGLDGYCKEELVEGEPVSSEPAAGNLLPYRYQRRSPACYALT